MAPPSASNCRPCGLLQCNIFVPMWRNEACPTCKRCWWDSTGAINRRAACEDEMSDVLLNLASNAKSGMLPALQHVRFVGVDYGREALEKRADEFKSYGIRLSAHELAE
ncbi:hypothetical protein CALCODRAFT_500287 [Calocera cornea HHB12733]|uniref:Uncharacterized protein n=1 Tax=Calocera cornea HHB12733 TaxID=1353952 RepID=A0A165E5N3_9BASI|nr:hypothetical protein CALCODRAFT_500287 [Calocera cornea HHB12733]